MLEGFGIATGISRLVGGQQVFAVGGEADGTNACAIEDIAQSVTLLWIGCRRDNGFAVRLEGDFRNVVRFVRGCKIFDYDFVAAGFECELELAVGGCLFLVVDIYFVMLWSADLKSPVRIAVAVQIEGGEADGAVFALSGCSGGIQCPVAFPDIVEGDGGF